MSLAVLAQDMASRGRGDDSMLIHMTPKEVAGLQSLAMAHGGSLTINPETGLPEAGFLSSILPMVAGFALNAFAPGFGTAIGSALGLGGAAGTAIGVGGIASLATGSLSRGLMAGLGAYGGAGLAEGMMGAGAGALADTAASSQYSNMASTMTEEAATEAGFGSVEEAAQNAAAQAAKSASFSNTDKLSAGWDMAKKAPWEFAKQNAMPLLAATAPMLADEGVQTVTKAPNQGYIRPHTFDPYTGQYTAQTPVKTDEWGSRQFAAGGAVAFAGGGFTNEQIAAYIRDQKLTTPEQINQAAAAFGISPEQMSAVQSPATAPSLAGINAASNDYQQAITATPELETQNNAWEVSQGLPWANQEQPAAKTTYLGVAPGTQTSYSSDQINDAINVSRSQGYTDAQIAQGAGRFGAEPQTVINALAANPAEGNEYLTQEQMSSMADEAASTNGLAGLAGLQDTFKANAAINDAVRSGYGDMENQFAPVAAAPVAPVAQAGLPALAAQQEEILAPVTPTFTTAQVAAYIRDQGLDTPAELQQAADVFDIPPTQMAAAQELLESTDTTAVDDASNAYQQAITDNPAQGVANDAFVESQGLPALAAQQEEILAPVTPTFTTAQVAAYIRDQQIDTPKELAKAAEVFDISPEQVKAAQDLLASSDVSSVNKASYDYAKAVEASPAQGVANDAFVESQGLPAIDNSIKAMTNVPTFTTEQVAAYIHDQNLKTPAELAKAAETFGISPTQLAAAQALLASGNTAGAKTASETYATKVAANPALAAQNTAWLATQGIQPYSGLPTSWSGAGGAGGAGGVGSVGTYSTPLGPTGTSGGTQTFGGASGTTPVPKAAIGTIAGTSTPVPDAVIGTIPGGTAATTPVPKAVIGTVGGVSGFPVDPVTLAKQQITEQGNVKTAKENALLDTFKTYVAANPTATPVELANYLDKIGLSPEVASRATGMSPQQFSSAYFDAKFNKMTGDSQAAYQYLMGKGAYPTKSSVGEIMRPYSEATLGIPGDISKKRMLFDPVTKTYKANPDYVPVSYEGGNKTYGQSDKAISAYLTGNPSNTIDKTMTWAVQNHVPIEQLAALLGRPISEVQAAYDAAKKTLAGAAAAAAGATGVVDYTGAGAGVSTGSNGLSSPDAGDTGGESAKNGGRIRAYAQGGISSLGSYSDGGQLLRGPGDGVSDSIPATIGRGQKAALADGEFVIPARIVSELGNGSTEAGSRALYKMLDRVQHARKKSIGKNRVAANTNAARFLPA